MTPTIAAFVLKFVWDKVFMSASLTGKGKGRRKPRYWLMALSLIAGVYLFGIDTVWGFVSHQLGLGGLKLPDLGINTTQVDQPGAIKVYFTSPGRSPDDPADPAKAVVGYIDGCKETVDVAAFELDNKVITAALVRAANRGVKVRLVTDTDYTSEDGPEALRAVGVTVVEDRRDALMHNKFMVFDNKAVWTGSMNFTENCAYKNNNNGVYLAIPELAANYATKFRWMFEDRKFGGKPNRLSTVPNPLIKLGDGTVIENYFAPDDGVAKRVEDLISEAKTSLDFLAFSFTHTEIARAMTARASVGVRIRGVFEKSQTAGGYSQYGSMKAAGLDVYTDANPRNMHHKVIVIDGVTTLTGSFNFSTNADRSNDENVIIVRNNSAIAKLFEAEVGRVYDAAKAAGSR